MALTIYDISQKAGVSTATVSRVLNGSEKVRSSTRQKVLKIMEENNYTPSAFARGMGLQSLKTIGILCADSSDLFLAKAIYYLQQELQANGYESLLCCTGYHPDIRKSYVDLILSKKIDGLILVGSHFIGTKEEENQYIRDASARIPIMVLNAAFDYPNVYSVFCDDYNTMRDAAAFLLKQGTSDILYLYDSESYSGIRKLKGFQAAMEEYSVQDYQDRIIFYGRGTTSSKHFKEIPPEERRQPGAIADFIESIVQNGTAFHGLIGAEDILAIGGIKYAQRRGLRIPEDLSVIGYNNSILTGCCTPELTSVDNCLEAQAHQLIRTLLGVLSGTEMPKRTVFSGKLVTRGTTLPLK